LLFGDSPLPPSGPEEGPFFPATSLCVTVRAPTVPLPTPPMAFSLSVPFLFHRLQFFPQFREGPHIVPLSALLVSLRSWLAWRALPPTVPTTKFPCVKTLQDSPFSDGPGRFRSAGLSPPSTRSTTLRRSPQVSMGRRFPSVLYAHHCFSETIFPFQKCPLPPVFFST